MAKRKPKSDNVTDIAEGKKPRASSKPAVAQALPTMEDLRIPVLDSTCQAIAACRTDLNELKKTEKGLLNTALKQMQTHLPEGQTVYTAAGVELVLTHLDKVRVRLVDDDNASGAGAFADGDDE